MVWGLPFSLPCATHKTKRIHAMVSTRKGTAKTKAKTKAKGKTDRDDAEPTTSDHGRMHLHPEEEEFIPPNKGGRHALRKKKEPVDTRVGELLHAIAGQLKSKGLEDEDGWEHDGVATALRQALALLPQALREALEPDDEAQFERHVGVLLRLLGGGAGAAGDAKGRKKRPAADTTKQTKQRKPNTACPDTVSDAKLEALFSSGKKGPSADACAALVMARVPASASAMRAFCEKREPEQVMRACAAIGGLCARVEERVAAFSFFSDVVAEGGVAEGVVKSAVSAVHALIASRVPKDSGWTMWSGGNAGGSGIPGHQDGASVSMRASETCYRLVASLVRPDEPEDSLREEGIDRLVSYASHLLHLLSPYAAVGLLTHVHDTKAADVGDMAMFMAVLEDGGPTKINLDASNVSISRPSVYLMYLYLARRAAATAEGASLATLSHRLLQKASATTPPECIMAWMDNQPPSSTMQLLMEKAGQGLPELSSYIVEEMRESDLHALASLSLAGVGEAREAAGATETGAGHADIDDLLFFESTEGALNVFPDDVDDWDDGDDDVDGDD